MVDQTATVSIQVPGKQLTILRETLRLSCERTKDPAKFIAKTALADAISHPSSTVDVSRWLYLRQFAENLGVESPI